MPGSDKPNVLIVDDDDMMRSYLRVILREVGVSVAGEVGEVAAARSFLQQRRVALVFLDINLPGEDGLSALKDLSSQYTDTAFIMLSGDSTKQNVQTAMAHGAKGFITKPITAAKVIQAVTRALERKA